MPAKTSQLYIGDGEYVEKTSREITLTSEVKAKIDNIPAVVNTFDSASTTDALSAAAGKQLKDLVDSVGTIGKYLSAWDCATGLPVTDPIDNPHLYKVGDYYVISNVAASSGTNYRPDSVKYEHGVASTAVETGTPALNDSYYYDGVQRVLQPSGGRTIVIDSSLSSTSTNPVENRIINSALNGKQATISDLATIRSGAALGATAIQPGANISTLTNNSGFVTSGTVDSKIATATSNLVTSSTVDSKIAAATTDFVTSNEVDTQIGAALTTGNYTTATDVSSAISTATQGMVTETSLATKGYQTQGEVNAAISNATLHMAETGDNITEFVNNAGYQTASQVSNTVNTAVAGKQDTLVSGTNIKTVNGTSILGSGDITIQGGVNIHDLTEKDDIDPDDEFVLSDSENIWNNKKITAGKILGIGDGVAIENISKGQFITCENVIQNVGSYSNSFVSVGLSYYQRQISIKRIGNGIAFDSITLYIAKNGTPTSNLRVEIQTDNNGNPSGTLIDPNAFAEITPSQPSTGATTIVANLNGEITIPDGTVCHIVFYTTTFSQSDFYEIFGRKTQLKLFKIKWSQDGTTRNDWVDHNSYFDLSNILYSNVNYNIYNKTMSFRVNESQHFMICGNQTSYTKRFTYTQTGSIAGTTKSPIANLTESGTISGGNRYFFQGSSDGKKAIVNMGNTYIYSMTLSTARDRDTATQTSSLNLQSLDGSSGSIYGIYISPDGLHLYWTRGSYYIYGATLSTARDVSTATYNGSMQIGTTSAFYAYCVTFSPDGKQMFTGGTQYIRAYSITTAWTLPSSGSPVANYNTGSSSYNIEGIGWSNGVLIYCIQSGSTFYLGQLIEKKIYGSETLLRINPDGLYGVEYGVATNTMGIKNYIPKASVGNYEVGQKVKYNINYNNNMSNLMQGQKYMLGTNGGVVAGATVNEVGIAIEPTILKLKQTY